MLSVDQAFCESLYLLLQDISQMAWQSSYILEGKIASTESQLFVVSLADISILNN